MRLIQHLAPRTQELGLLVEASRQEEEVKLSLGEEVMAVLPQVARLLEQEVEKVCWHAEVVVGLARCPDLSQWRKLRCPLLLLADALLRLAEVSRTLPRRLPLLPSSPAPAAS